MPKDRKRSFERDEVPGVVQGVFRRSIVPGARTNKAERERQEQFKERIQRRRRKRKRRSKFQDIEPTV